jgi:hypothetical protein
MTTMAKADELEKLRAALDVERAQNKTLHAELDARRSRQLKLAGFLDLIAERLRARGRADDALLAFVLAPIAEVLRDEERQAFSEWLREAPTQPERLAFVARRGDSPLEVTGAATAVNDAARCDPFDVPRPPAPGLSPGAISPELYDEIGAALAEQCTCGGVAGGRACASTCAIFAGCKVPAPLVDVDECAICGARLVGHPAMTGTQHGFVPRLAPVDAAGELEVMDTINRRAGRKGGPRKP